MEVIRQGGTGKAVGGAGKGSGSTKKPRSQHWDPKLKADVWDDTGEAVKPGDPTTIETPAMEPAAPEHAGQVAPAKPEMASPGMTGPPRREDYPDGIVGESNFRKATKAYEEKLAAQKSTAKSNANTLRK